MNKQTLRTLLTQVEVIKQGQFTLKSGEISSVYVDLRRIISYPHLLRSVAQTLWETFKQAKPQAIPQLLCGVPYGALPLTTCIAIEQTIPMVLCRKTVKSYGGKKKIEGVYQMGQTCLLIEDVVTTGSSLLETLISLKEVGIIVSDALVFVDREQGGMEKLSAQACQLHPVFTLKELSA
jgi:orotate phosphoribosyltransferase